MENEITGPVLKVGQRYVTRNGRITAPLEYKNVGHDIYLFDPYSNFLYVPSESASEDYHGHLVFGPDNPHDSDLMSEYHGE